MTLFENNKSAAKGPKRQMHKDEMLMLAFSSIMALLLLVLAFS